MGEITILVVGLFVLLLLAFIFSEYDFFSPSFILCAVFTFGSLLALYATISWGIPDDVFSSSATWIMLSGTLVFIIFEQITRHIILPKRKKRIIVERIIESKPIHISHIKMVLLVAICIIGTGLYVQGIYQKVRANGYSGGFDLGAIAVFNHRLSFSDDVEGGISRIVSIVQSVAKIAMYMSMYIFFNNVVCCHEKIKKNLKYFIPVITWVPNVLVTSSRGSYLQIAGAIVMFYYIAISRRNHWTQMRRNYRKLIRYASISFIAILAAFYGAAATGVIGRQTDKTFLDSITIYLGAPIIHFHQFMTSPPADVIYFGQETFNKMLPLLSRLGIVGGSVTGQLEMRSITALYRGNVYTFFRRPYHDFGLMGMYIVVAMTAIVFSYVYYGRIYGRYQSYKNDRILILYSYFFYVIYIFSVDNALYLYIYPSIILFFISTYLLYAFLFGKIKLRIKA